MRPRDASVGTDSPRLGGPLYESLGKDKGGLPGGGGWALKDLGGG